MTINALLYERYGRLFVRFTDVRYPTDYADDMVHLDSSEKTAAKVEFFDRKRFGTLKTAFSRTERKKGLSQDLLALHTVSRAHSNNKQDKIQKKSIKNVDLDKFRSCTRSIEEVDMGPSSPTPTPSRLLLMEPKHDLSQSGSGPRPHRTDKGNLDFTPQKYSSDSFLKPASLSDHSGKSDIKHHRKRTPQKHAPLETPQSSDPDFVIKEDGRTSSEDRDKHFHTFSFKKPGKRSQSCFDPFANEDFQITPLRKYSKHDSPSEQNNHSKKKREHSSFDSSELNKNKNERFGHSTYFTSTPLKEEKKGKHRGSKHKFDFSFLGLGVSPIDKLPKRHVPELEDDFKYQPRPMVTTPEACFTKSQTPVFSTSSFMSSESDSKRKHELTESRESWEKPSFSRQSNLLDTESVFKEQVSNETYCKENFLESVEKNNVFLNTSSEDQVGTVLNDCSISSHRSDEIVLPGSNSSLTQYRQKLQLSENILNSSIQSARDIKQNTAEKSETLANEMDEIPFPNTFDPDFQYQPHSNTRPKEDKNIDIMKLYQKHKETGTADDSLLLTKADPANIVVMTERLGVSEKHVADSDLDKHSIQISGGEARQFTRSPKVGEEYPEYLHHHSVGSTGLTPGQETHALRKNSQETKEWSTPSVKKSNVGEKLTQNKVKSVTNSHMDEVLQEMKELEQQDCVIEELSEDRRSVQEQSPVLQEPSTELTEIDHFLDSERKFWADIQTLADEQVKDGVSAEADQTNVIIDETLSASQTEYTQQAEKQSVIITEPIQNPDNETKVADASADHSHQLHSNSRCNYMADVLTTDHKTEKTNTSLDIDTGGSRKVCESNIPVNECCAKSNLNQNIDITESTEKIDFGLKIVHYLWDKRKNPNTATDSKLLNASENPSEKQNTMAKQPDNLIIYSVPNADKSMANNNCDIGGSDKESMNLMLQEIVSQNQMQKVSAVKGPQIQTKQEKSNPFNNLSQKQLTETCIATDEASIKSEFPAFQKVVTSREEMLENQQQFKSGKTLFQSKNFDSSSKTPSNDIKKYSYNIMEADIVEMKMLQDPQVSSGCNQEIQTDKVVCIDVASSPFVGSHSPVSTKSVGVQCKFESVDELSTGSAQSKVPKLGSLASSFLGSGYQRSMSFVSFLSKNLGHSSSNSSTADVGTNEISYHGQGEPKVSSEHESQSHDTADSVLKAVHGPINTDI